MFVGKVKWMKGTQINACFSSLTLLVTEMKRGGILPVILFGNKVFNFF
jgi:hypothetical protein